MANENGVTRVALQLRHMRERAGLTQAELAAKVGTRQSAIARLESMSYGKFSISMLQKIADYFDVVAWVEFAPYSSFLRRTANLSPHAITPKPYTEEFDGDGNPLPGLMLAFDGSAICRSHYIAAEPTPGARWNIVLESAGSSRVYGITEHA